MRAQAAVLSSVMATGAFAGLIPRQNLPPNGTTPYSLASPDTIGARSAQIADIRANFQYGPDVIQGEGVYFPTGSYADQMLNFDNTAFFGEQIPWGNRCKADAMEAAVAVASSGGLHNLTDWFKFYELGFKITIPTGPYPGMLSNGTSDLLFAMERLSTAPYAIRRLASDDELSFQVDDATAMKLTTMTQQDLLSHGRLFYADYRDQSNVTLTSGHYAGAAEGFFFLHPTSNQFLPLAIRLNRGSNLIYTPLDGPNDWLFAKIALSINDLWYHQWYHLETTHVLVDIVFEAAVRTLPPDHPVYAVLNRLAYQTFAMRVSAVKTLLQSGGPVDRLFFSHGGDAAAYAARLYHEDGAGDWLNTEFFTDLRLRGLIGGMGPRLPHFPFLEDAAVVHRAINQFMMTYVQSYYTDDQAVQADSELANFVKEANPAGIINFPTAIASQDDLVSFLTHFAMKVSVVHGVLNTNEPAKSTGSLPYHPMSFYQPLPTQKGLDDIVSFMPNLTQSASQLTLFAAFNRPFITNNNPVGSSRTLSEMFDDAEFINRTNKQAQEANAQFKQCMAEFSAHIQTRKFDENGLSQGMPFIWSALDPFNIPFYVAI